MPELPEVEIVCRNLSEMIPPGSVIREWIFFRGELRFKIPKTALRGLVGLALRKIQRRAKYILFYFDEKILLSHLGMTGSWRREKSGWKPQKHDHLAFVLTNGSVFVYADPRRFGFVEVLLIRDLEKRFKGLGAEPLDSHTDFDSLTRQFRKLNAPIKNALMNQKILVGVGNIYASEVLFAAGISPQKKCSKITQAQYHKIWFELKKILNKAVFMGGSTIENYRNGFGEKGDFQSEFFVYGKKGEHCRRCGGIIKAKTLAGRSTFWCSGCQK